MKLLILSFLFATFGIAQEPSTLETPGKPKEAQFEKDARSQIYTVRNFVKELEEAKREIALLQAQITVLRQELQIAELPEVKSARCALAAEVSADAARKKPVEKK